MSPQWADTLFPVPTPAALAVLIDILWAEAAERRYLDEVDAICRFDFMFDLVAVPAAAPGWASDTYERERGRALYSPPEFIPFGSLGDGGYVGWAVPAPELGRTDHPVCIADGHQCGTDGLSQIGADTREGLEFMLSRTLARWRDGQYQNPDDVPFVDRIARELGVTPAADRFDWGRATEVTVDVPPGWRYEPSADGIGVLAPADAFADRAPVVVDYLDSDNVEPAAADAEAHLAAGHPATALLGIKDSLANSNGDAFPDLESLWERAYRDLGRPQLINEMGGYGFLYGWQPTAPH